MKCPIYPTSFRLKRCHPCAGRIVLNSRGGSHCPFNGGNGNGPGPLPPLKPMRKGVEWDDKSRPGNLKKFAAYGIDHVRLHPAMTNWKPGITPSQMQYFCSPFRDDNGNPNPEYYRQLAAYADEARRYGMNVIVTLFQMQSGLMLPGGPKYGDDNAYKQLFNYPKNAKLLRTHTTELAKAISHRRDNCIIEMCSEPLDRRWMDNPNNEKKVLEWHKFVRSVLKHECHWPPDRIATNGKLGEPWTEPGEYYSYHHLEHQKYGALKQAVANHGCKVIFSTDGQKSCDRDRIRAEVTEAKRLDVTWTWWNPQWGYENNFQGNWPEDVMRIVGQT